MYVNTKTMYTYIYIYVCIHIYIYMHIFATRVYIYIQHTYTYIHIHTCLSVRVSSGNTLESAGKEPKLGRVGSAKALRSRCGIWLRVEMVQYMRGSFERGLGLL